MLRLESYSLDPASGCDSSEPSLWVVWQKMYAPLETVHCTEPEDGSLSYLYLCKPCYNFQNYGHWKC